MIWNVQKHDAALESAVSIAAKLQAAQDIRAMDTSGDNKVDIDEFKSCGGSEAEFKALDINGDGVLDELELRKRGASQIREAENHEQLCSSMNLSGKDPIGNQTAGHGSLRGILLCVGVHLRWPIYGPL